MSDELEDLRPDDLEGHARLLQSVLLRACEGGRTAEDDAAYMELRRRMMRDPVLKQLLPSFVREHRDLGHLWPYLKGIHSQWDPRRQHVRGTLTPLFNYIERVDAAPIDAVASDVLQGFEPEAVHAVWEKALARRHTDPEGAITSARTLLETVCKHILDGMNVSYSETADIPALMKLTAEQLSLSPSQHSEEAFKRILGGAANVVEGLGSLRNKIGDAHGGGRRRVKPSLRHAQLAVNMAGAAATFLVETWEVRLEEFLEDLEDSKGG